MALFGVPVGPHGSPKTAVARRILFCHVDEEASRTNNPRRTPKTCRGLQGHVFNTDISVIDTPEGFFGVNDSISTQHAKNIAAQVQFLSAPGPHAFLLEIQIYTPRKIVRNTVDQLCRHFGDNVLKHIVVLFTSGSSLQVSLSSVTEYINKNRDIQQLVHNCGNRYLLFDDTCDVGSLSNHKQVKQLMAMVNQMISSNGGEYIKLCA